MSQVDSIVETDGALILGAGIAGLFTALKLSPMPSIVLAGTRPGLSGSSAWAQGGIAAAMGEDDSWQSHAHDTMLRARVCAIQRSWIWWRAKPRTASKT